MNPRENSYSSLIGRNKSELYLPSVARSLATSSRPDVNFIKKNTTTGSGKKGVCMVTLTADQVET